MKCIAFNGEMDVKQRHLKNFFKFFIGTFTLNPTFNLKIYISERGILKKMINLIIYTTSNTSPKPPKIFIADAPLRMGVCPYLYTLLAVASVEYTFPQAVICV